MELTPYLNFNGQCAEAFKLYERVLGGRIVAMHTHGETPARDHVPAEWHDKIMHVRLEIGDKALMGSDAPPDQYTAPQGIYVSISVGDPAEGERIFAALAEQGTITMPFQKTFWSPGFGMAVDRFGTPWMVNCEPAAV
jgi:PhnB protein